MPSPRPLALSTALGALFAACAAPPRPEPPPATPTPAIASSLASPPPSAPASAIVVAASASVSPPVASATPTSCGSAVEQAPPNAFASEGVPGPAEEPFGDLDGDGVPEHLISYPASFVERGILVLARAPFPTCYRVLYDGVGSTATILKTKTAGSLDLAIPITPITSRGRGSAIAIARRKGEKYELVRTERCRGIDGKPIPKAECAAIVSSYKEP